MPHKKKPRTRTTSKSKKSRSRAATGASVVDLGAASVAELKAELSRRQRRAKALQRQHARLLEELARVEQEIQSLGDVREAGTVSSPPKGIRQRRSARGPNSKTLRIHLTEVLTGQVMTVTEAAEAVCANGYHSSSKTFRTIVNQTLIADEAFQKVGHGRYTVRS